MTPMDCSPPGSSVHWILQASLLEWVAVSSSLGIFLTQGSNLSLLCLLYWQGPLCHLGSPNHWTARELRFSRFLNDPLPDKPSLTTSQKDVSYTAGQNVNGTSLYIVKLKFYVLFDIRNISTYVCTHTK